MQISKFSPNWALGVPVSDALSVSSATAPVAYSVSGGSLPAGLTLGPGGTFSGTPSSAGPFDFTVSVIDTVSDTATLRVQGAVAPTVAQTSAMDRLSTAAPSPTTTLGNHLGSLVDTIAGDVSALEGRIVPIEQVVELVASEVSKVAGAKNPLDAIVTVGEDLAVRYLKSRAK